MHVGGGVYGELRVCVRAAVCLDECTRPVHVVELSLVMDLHRVGPIKAGLTALQLTGCMMSNAVQWQMCVVLCACYEGVWSFALSSWHAFSACPAGCGSWDSRRCFHPSCMQRHAPTRV